MAFDVHNRAFRLLVLILSCLMPFAAQGGSTVAKGSAFQLYASVPNTSELRAIDPDSLADDAAVDPLEFQGQWPPLAVSADGSTFVVVHNEEVVRDDGGLDKPAIVVLDGMHGAERTRIPLTEPLTQAFDPKLSADGRRLVVTGGIQCDPYGCSDQVFQAFDTASGRLLAAITVSGDPVWPVMMDPAGERLYVPTYRIPEDATPTTDLRDAPGPWPLRIAAYDLTSGERGGELVLDDVMVGNWQEGQIGAMPLMQTMRPGIALSPDGATIAVVDASLGSVTAVDTGTMTVVGTRPLHEQESFVGRALRWIGILPHQANAKAMEGTTLTAIFSHDSKQLYVIGNTIEVGKTVEDISGHGLGVLRVDLASGAVTDHVLDGRDIAAVLPTPDGRAVYVMYPKTPWWAARTAFAGHENVLERLDGPTLRSTASREFAEWTLVELFAMPGW